MQSGIDGPLLPHRAQASGYLFSSLPVSLLSRQIVLFLEQFVLPSSLSRRIFVWDTGNNLRILQLKASNNPGDTRSRVGVTRFSRTSSSRRRKYFGSECIDLLPVFNH